MSIHPAGEGNVSSAFFCIHLQFSFFLAFSTALGEKRRGFSAAMMQILAACTNMISDLSFRSDS